MKKNRTKPKGAPKAQGGEARSQVVKLRPKARVSWTAKLPSIRQYWTGARQFLVEAWQELRKVNWPSRKEALGGTGVVLVLVIIISLFLGMVDFGLARLVRRFIH